MIGETTFELYSIVLQFGSCKLYVPLDFENDIMLENLGNEWHTRHKQETCPIIWPQTIGIYDEKDADQDTSPTMDTKSERINLYSPSAAVRNTICVITRNPMAMTLTDFENPVYQQIFPSIS